MATRLYLGRASFSAIDPGVLGTWDHSYRQRYKMEPTKQNTSFTTYSITGMSSEQKTLMRQFISRPMDAGILFQAGDTWTCNIRFKESSTALNIFPRLFFQIVSQTGIPRSYSHTAVGSSEFSTSLSSREWGFTAAGGSYTTQAGDRIVLEVGWDKQASTTGDASISLGDNDASDLSGSGDTGTNNPWFEYSGTITFQAEGEAPTQGDNYQLTSYISAVLDEWV